MHVQSVQNYCFSLSNMQISDVLVSRFLKLPIITTTINPATSTPTSNNNNNNNNNNALKVLYFELLREVKRF